MKQEAWLVAAWKEKGIPVPASYQEALEEEGQDEEPELDWLEQQYLVLFNAASTCRPVGAVGALPLPFTAMADVLDRHGWSGTEFMTAMHMMRALDEVMLDHYANRPGR